MWNKQTFKHTNIINTNSRKLVDFKKIRSPTATALHNAGARARTQNWWMKESISTYYEKILSLISKENLSPVFCNTLTALKKLYIFAYKVYWYRYIWIILKYDCMLTPYITKLWNHIVIIYICITIILYLHFYICFET